MTVTSNRDFSFGKFLRGPSSEADVRVDKTTSALYKSIQWRIVKMKSILFLLHFFATQIIGGTKELVVLL